MYLTEPSHTTQGEMIKASPGDGPSMQYRQMGGLDWTEPLEEEVEVEVEVEASEATEVPSDPDGVGCETTTA